MSRLERENSHLDQVQKASLRHLRDPGVLSRAAGGIIEGQEGFTGGHVIPPRDPL